MMLAAKRRAGLPDCADRCHQALTSVGAGRRRHRDDSTSSSSFAGSAMLGTAHTMPALKPAAPTPSARLKRAAQVLQGDQVRELAYARLTVRLFRKGSRVCQRGRSWWVSRSEGRGGLGGGETDRPDRGFPGPFQAPAVAIWWLWSFSKLWVAVISRHSERAADRPRRWKRSMRRLDFVCPNTGSVIAWRSVHVTDTC